MWLRRHLKNQSAVVRCRTSSVTDAAGMELVYSADGIVRKILPVLETKRMHVIDTEGWCYAMEENKARLKSQGEKREGTWRLRALRLKRAV